MIDKTLWRLTPFTAKDKNGNVVDIGLETKDIKLMEGEKYIQRLKDEGQNVVKVENTGDYLVIYIENGISNSE